MKKILIALYIFIAVFTVSAQEKAYTPALISPAMDTKNLMPVTLLDWEAVSGYMNIRYEVQISDVSNFSNVVSSLSTTQSAIKTPSLKLNTTYYWRVRALDDNNTSDWSAGWNYTTLDTIRVTSPNQTVLPPSPPLGPRYSFSWGTIGNVNFEGLSKYEMVFSDTEDFDPSSPYYQQIIIDSVNTGGNTQSKYIEHLAFGKQYFWKMRIYNNATGSLSSTGGWTSVKTFFVVDKNVPSKPEMNKNIDVDPDVNLVLKTTYLPCEYIFQIDQNSSFADPREFSSTTTTLKNYDTLLYGETYYWRAKMKYESQVSDWTESGWWFTVIEKPALTEPLNNGILGSDGMLKCKRITATDSYICEISTSADFAPGLTFSSVVPQPKSTTVEARISAFSGLVLEDGASYYWRIKAVNNRNESQWSLSRVFKYSKVGIESFDNNEVTVYPNPSKDGKFYINVSENLKNAKLSIYDLTGRVRYMEVVDLMKENTLNIDVVLPKGLYILEINSGSVRVNKKITVM